MKKNIPVVLLHGWNITGKKYSKLSDFLKKKGYKVYAPDLPGFGTESLLKKTLELDDYVLFLKTFLAKHSLPKIFLVGHSFGGRVSIKFTAKYPQNIKKLILTGVPGLPPVRGCKIKFFGFVSKAGKIVFSLPLLSVFQKYARKGIYKLAGASDYQIASGKLKETFLKIIREDLVTPMQKISVPTVLIWGKKDKSVPEKIAKEMSRIITNSILEVFPQSGHKLPYENTDEFARTLLKHLK